MKRIPMVVILIGTLGVWAGVDGSLTKAHGLYDHAQYSAALEALDQVLKSEPDNIDAHLLAAAACLELGNATCVENHLAQVGKTAPETAGYQVLLGRSYLSKAVQAGGDKEMRRVWGARAVDAFTLELARRPSDPKLLALRACALRAAGDFEGSAKDYRAWLALEPKNAEAYGAFAAMLAEGGRWSEADALIQGELLGVAGESVLRRGICERVAWDELRPLAEAVVATAARPQVKAAVVAYRAISTSHGYEGVLALLDYLDVDPDDSMKVFAAWRKETKGRYDFSGTDGIVMPKAVVNPMPTYPDVARKAHLEGKVTLLCRVSRDGKVESIHALTSSDGIFEEAAVNAIRQAQYTPATRNDEPIDYPFITRVDFRLR